jgi:hypothetical protein
MRQYLIGSWSNADEYDYSGEQLMGNRLGASREVPHFLANGRANVAKYGDNTAKVTKVPLADRILPQAKRVRVLTEQLIELESERKAGMDVHTYSKLRDILIVKRDRAEELLKKVTSVRPIREETEEVGVETPYSSSDVDPTHTEVATSCGVSWMSDFIDDLPPSNSFKSFLKMSCKVVKTAVHYKHKISSYLNELKEV